MLALSRIHEAAGQRDRRDDVTARAHPVAEWRRIGQLRRYEQLAQHMISELDMRQSIVILNRRVPEAFGAQNYGVDQRAIGVAGPERIRDGLLRHADNSMRVV